MYLWPNSQTVLTEVCPDHEISPIYRWKCIVTQFLDAVKCIGFGSLEHEYID